ISTPSAADHCGSQSRWGCAPKPEPRGAPVALLASGSTSHCRRRRREATSIAPRSSPARGAGEEGALPAGATLHPLLLSGSLLPPPSAPAPSLPALPAPDPGAPPVPPLGKMLPDELVLLLDVPMVPLLLVDEL